MNCTKIDEQYLTRCITPRLPDTHKGDYGKVLIIGGSIGYTGAPVLCSRAALRSGAGLVFLATPMCIYPIQASRCVEEVCVPAPSDDIGFARSAADELVERAAGCNVCIIGPGLGRSAGAKHIVYETIRRYHGPLIIDADGINAVSENIDILRERTGETILTPHAVEFSRLGGNTDNGRESGALKLARSLNSVVVLKGNRTVVASPDGTVLVNTTGNPGMAVGGSGDVLAGVIGSLVGQGLDALHAAACGVYIHGLAGDMAADELGEFGMLPSDIIGKLPYTLKRFSSRN